MSNVSTIFTSGKIAAIRLNRLGAATHATNMDQRSVGLDFTETNPTNGHSWRVQAPANADIPDKTGQAAPPGMYMLFVLRPKADSLSGQTMIPSVAKIVNVKKP